MSAFQSLLGTADLVGKNGSVPVSSLDGNTAVALYFSAHWCPPCKMFTPQLAKTYNKIRADGKKFEVVFVSSDRDQSSFDEYYGSMPWLALPFSAREAKKKLSKTFGVKGIPALIILDGKGDVITTGGRAAVGEDPAGENFPWVPPTLQEALGDTFIKGSETVKAADLSGKTLALYFSAHWCGPCRGFTPKLAAVYKKLQDAGKPFEIIFVSADRNEAAFDEYRATMPWAALPFANREGEKALSSRFNVQGIPSLVILDGYESGNLINPSATSAVGQDSEGANFPWPIATTNDLKAVSSDPSLSDALNESVCLLAFIDGLDEEAQKESLKAVQSVADQAYSEARKAGNLHADIRFFTATSNSPVAERVRALTKLKGNGLIILDIPDDGGFYVAPECPTTVAGITAFVDGCKKKEGRQQLEK